MNNKAFFLLIFCNVLWSAAYSVSKNLMADFHPLEVAFLRYSFALAPLLAFCLIARRHALSQWVRGFKRVDWCIPAVGFFTFFVSPLCQMTGLSLTRSVDSSLMIALEPLFTIIAAALLLKEGVTRRFALSILLALAGVAVVTELSLEKLLSFKDARLIGNLVMLISLMSETAYSILAKPVEDRDPVVFMTVSLAVGVALLGAYNLAVYGPERVCGLAVLVQANNPVHWASALYLGVACTSFAYFAWMIVLKTASVSAMAMTLYVQPVLGILWGSLLLGESATAYTFAGGALILFAVWLGSQSRKK